MKKNFLSACVVASVVLFSQCKKDDSSAPAGANYSPLTTSTNWTYKYTEGTTTSTFKATVTGRDTLISGKTYKVISNSDGTTDYLAKVDNNYYRFASFPAIGINSFEELYLIDNKAVNDTWTNTATFKYSGVDVTATLNYVIKGKGESRTVNGKAFTNVTHVRLDILLLGSPVGGGDFYYQDGVGLIEDTILVTPPFGGQPYSTSEQIVSYEIK